MAIEPFLQVTGNNFVGLLQCIMTGTFYICHMQAEVDRKYSRELREQLEREAEVMKDVPGWEVGKPAYVKRWRRPLLDRSAGDWLGPEAPIYKAEK